MIRPTAMLAALLLWAATAAPVRGQIAVDVALVLAVDVSLSIDAEEFALQRAGYAAAFRNERVVAAITGGSAGAVAVTYLQWSVARGQQQVTGWRLINDPRTPARFAPPLPASR